MTEPSSDIASPGADRAEQLVGSGYSVVMALMFSVVVIFAATVNTGGRPFLMLSFRFGLASVLLFIGVAATGRPLFPATGERRAVILAGTLGYATESALYFAALSHGKAGAVTLLFYVYPVWVMLATIGMDRRPPGTRLLIALSLALGGSAIVVIGGGKVEVEPLGIVLAIGCSIAYATYLVAADRTVKRTDPLTAAAWLSGGAALGNTIYSILFHATVLPRGRHDWFTILGMAVFSAGAFAAMLAGLQRVGALRNSIIGVTEPFAVAILAWVFLHQGVSVSTAIGGALILTGAVLASLVRTTRLQEPNL
ncbi:MAG: DMT family transporter [Actinomycetota bacterium]